MLHHHHPPSLLTGPRINNKTILHLVPTTLTSNKGELTPGVWSEQIVSLADRDLLFLEWISDPRIRPAIYPVIRGSRTKTRIWCTITS